NVWKKSGYHEIITDVNDPVMRGALLILYPPIPPEGWVEPGLDQVVEKLNSLKALGFELTNNAIGDALILFERNLKDIGDTLIDAFANVLRMTKEDILSICLRELLDPERTFEREDSLEFVVNAIDTPEEKILSTFKEYGIENPIDVYLDNNGSLPQDYAFLKNSPIVYKYMLVKFGARSRITRFLMNEITTARIGEAKLRKFNPSLVLSSVTIAGLWNELEDIFNIYCMADVPLELQFLPLIKTCSSDTVIKYLFEGYLTRLFGFEVEFQLPATVQIPILD
ncbi:7835_t:CDS:1, partial [Paraglomus brasilianum]